MTGYEDIKELYATIPTMECQGKCHTYCRGIDPTSTENEQIRRRKGVKLTLHNTREICPLLDRITKRCTGYEVRPTVCRLWGLTERMACPHGCRPERLLTYKEEERIMLAAEYLSGDKTWDEYQLWSRRIENPEILALMREIANHPMKQPENMRRIEEIEKAQE